MSKLMVTYIVNYLRNTTEWVKRNGTTEILTNGLEKVWVNRCGQMAVITMVTGRMIYSLDTEGSDAQTGQYMLANGWTEWKMAKVSKHGQMAANMWVIGKIILLRDMVTTKWLMEAFILVTGWTISSTEKVTNNGLMEENTTDTTNKESKMAKDYLLGKLESNMKEIGSMENNTEKVHS